VSKRAWISVLAVLAGLAFGGPAAAITLSVGMEGGSTATYQGSGNYVDIGGGITFWSLVADVNNPVLGDGYAITGWNAFLKEDPFVTNNISLTNTTASAATFTVTLLLPISAFAYDATVASSIGVTVTDSNASGSASVSTASPDGIYSGTVNGSTILTLLAHSTTISCATAGCSTTVPDNSALPELAAGPGVATSIGITLKFTLSAFDSVGITSRFEIVPEPTTLALLGLGGIAFAAARRRAA
jgi:hypothetical protein